MSTPTDTELQNATINLNNMIQFNTDLYTYGNGKIITAYSLLSQQDDKDLGLQIGLNLLTSAMEAIGAEAGFAGAIAGNFVSSMISSYAENTPISIAGPIASIEERFEQTSLQAGRDLAEICDNPAAYWDQTYSGTLITPFVTKVISANVSDLGQPDLFPSKDQSTYQDYLIEASYALDQSIWSVLLKNFIITAYLPATEYKTKYYSEQDMENNAAGFYGAHPAYYNTWVYEAAKKDKNDAYWQTQHNIGTGASSFHDGSLSSDACQHLFIDSYDNVIINSEGLFNRSFVFNSLGIPTTSKTLNN